MCEYNGIVCYKPYIPNQRDDLLLEIEQQNLCYKVIEKEELGDDGYIKVLYGENTNDENRFYVEYRIVERREVIDELEASNAIDISGRYINNFRTLDFANTEIRNRNIDARLCLCDSIINFDKCTFIDCNITFDYTNLRDGLFSCTYTCFNNCMLNFEYMLLNNKHLCFTHATYQNTNYIFFKPLINLDLCACKNYSILIIGNNLKTLKLKNFINIGQIVLKWDESNARSAIIVADRGNISEQKKHKQIANDFLLLKENYRNMGKYEWEDAAYRAYMEYYTKSLEPSPKKAFNKFFGLISGYGTEVTKIFGTCLISLLVFPIFYTSAFLPHKHIPNNYFSIKTQLGAYFQSMYFSTITFLTIGYGKFNPIDLDFEWYQTMITGIEGFWGLLLMSLVTVTIVRKILR